MPNLVVYVPADVARALEVKGVSQDLQRKACKEVLAGLANGGLEEGVARASGRREAAAPSSSPPSGEDAVPREPVSESRVTASPSSPGSRQFRPDPKSSSGVSPSNPRGGVEPLRKQRGTAGSFRPDPKRK